MKVSYASTRKPHIPYTATIYGDEVGKLTVNQVVIEHHFSQENYLNRYRTSYLEVQGTHMYEYLKIKVQ